MQQTTFTYITAIDTFWRQKKRHFIFLICLLIPCFGVSQEFGVPNYQNYPIKTYGAAEQNWAVVQDFRGVLYFANNNTVLEYDGINWNKVYADNRTSIRSLGYSKDSIIYAGAQNSFGYLEPDTTGVMQYRPLAHLLPKEERNFGDIWQTLSTPAGIYFRANKALFRYNPQTKSIKIWKNESKFHTAFYVNEQLYVRVRKKELLRMTAKDSLQEIPESKALFEGEHIFSMLPYEENKLLIGTLSKGLYLFDVSKKHNVFQKFKTQDADFFTQNQIYGGVLNSDNYLYYSLRNGIIIINKDGQVVQKVNKDKGINNNRVWNAYSDQHQDTWLTLNDGISKLETHSPLTFLGDKVGLKGFANKIIRHQDYLYVASSVGVFRLKGDKFEEITPVSDYFWEIFSHDEGLLLGSAVGIHLWKDEKIHLLFDTRNVYKFFQAKSGKIYVGQQDGLGLLTYQNGKWNYEFPILGIEDDIRNIIQDKKENIWLRTKYNGLYKLSNNRQADTLAVSHLDTLSGLPTMTGIRLNLDEDSLLLINTPEGTCSYDYYDEKFAPNLQAKFLQVLSPDESIVAMTTDSHGHIWLSVEKGGKQNLKPVIYGYEGAKIDSVYLSALQKIPNNIKIKHIYPEKNGIVWIGTNDGLYRFNQNLQRKYNTDFHALIRKVTVYDSNADTDSVLFHGTYFKVKNNQFVVSTTQPEELKYKLSSNYNSFIFEFTTPFFVDEKFNLFRYKLEGYDKSWSNWTTEHKKEYTNLSIGEYTFQVEAKNIYGKKSAISEYHFTIRPPWYRTNLAYFIFAIIVIGIIAGIAYVAVWYNTRKLKKQKAELEKEVEKRTQTILEKTIELEQKHEELTQQAEELKAQRDQLQVHELQLIQTNTFILKQKEELSDTNEELAKKNKSITDSINYAKRIQSAMLPDMQDITNALPESFIYFRPKDIVSGDFFWFTERRGKYVITAADCTGHGVPGALMSIIGMNLLYQTVTVKGITTSSQILDKLHSGVKNVLRQSKTQNSDGMDISLCVIDPKNQLIEYSGAKNPLVYIQNDKMKLIKGDKQPIGGMQYEEKNIDEKFARHIVNLQDAPETICYLYSDGYQDQFSEKGQKFLSKRFRKKLHDNSALTMKEQYQQLRMMFTKWKGKARQTDDVLVVGFKIKREDNFDSKNVIIK